MFSSVDDAVMSAVQGKYPEKKSVEGFFESKLCKNLEARSEVRRQCACDTSPQRCVHSLSAIKLLMTRGVMLN